MAGLIQIYCGDGKGKTTAAAGLALRAASAGMKVIFCQFFKDGSSGEIKILSGIENVETLNCKENLGFYSKMDEARRQRAGKLYRELFETALAKAETAGLLVLDEIISACNHAVVDEEKLIDFLRHKPEGLEVVLTGRNPSKKLMDCAEYISEIKKLKHPFDEGIKARKGIEF